MGKYNAIVFDMDGTLLDNSKQLLSSSIKAISDAADAGKDVAICSGRAVSEVKKYCTQLCGVHYAVCSNGSIVYDLVHDCVLSEQPIAPETVQALFDVTERYDVYIQIMSLQSILERENHKRIADYHAEAYARLFEETGRFVRDLREYCLTKQPSVYKFTPYAKSEAVRNELLPQLSALGVEAAFAEATGIECSACGVSKGSGLKALCEVLQWSADSVIAVGDADNDLKMLSFAGLPVAMGNANIHVKRIAKAIVSDNENGGCAEAIYKYLLV